MSTRVTGCAHTAIPLATANPRRYLSSMFKTLIVLFAATLATTAPAQAPRPDQVEFRALYKELVETNTTLSAGSCTLAAERMAARLRKAGFTDAELTLFSVPEHPKDGGLVAVLPGSDPKAKAILLLAHLDVVEARRADWTRDPFTLIEEGGYFYGRGTTDDKSQAAIWTDSMARFRASGYRPRHTIKMALTCGEESDGAFNGAQYLTEHKRDLIDAGFALNEGGGGRLDAAGKPVALAFQVGEKVYQDYSLEVTNPGGHSSQPVVENAIYRLSAALAKVGAYEFPVQFNDTTRAYFTRLAAIEGGATGAAMTALVANPNDAAADRIVSADKQNHSLLRTTCVATRVDAGHANNALPQRATAIVNCRIFPGVAAARVEAALETAIADPLVKVVPVTPPPSKSPAVPLDPKVFGPAEKLAAAFFPGVPMLPFMDTGASDAVWTTPAGIPTYGVPGIFDDADLGNIHGLNERIRVKALYDGRDYLFRLIKLYADAQ